MSIEQSSLGKNGSSSSENTLNRSILIGAIGVMFTGLLTTLSRASVISLAAGSAFFALKSEKLRKPLFLSLIIFLLIDFIITKGSIINLQANISSQK